MTPEQKRNMRIMELSKMLLNRKSVEQVRKRAYQMASKKTAESYVEQAIRNVSK